VAVGPKRVLASRPRMSVSDWPRAVVQDGMMRPLLGGVLF
jgi:hypothetical protein